MVKLLSSLIMIAASAVVALWFFHWNDSIINYPLDVPLPAKTGSFRMPPISLNATYGHTVQVRLDTIRPWNDLLCVTGAKNGTTQAPICAGRAPDLDLDWTVSENNRIVAAGSTAKTSYLNNEGKVAVRDLGFFRGVSGHTYVLDVVVRGNPSALTVLRPRLQIQLVSTYGQVSGILALVLAPVCGVTFLLGIVGVIRAFLRRRKPNQASVG